MPPLHWPEAAIPEVTPWPMPRVGSALGRGALGRCPACGRHPLFKGYLKVVAACPGCGAPLGQARADDAPPYFTILLVGHIVVPAMLLTQRNFDPSTFVMSAIFVPLTLVLALGLLRPIKGATVGAMLVAGLMKPAAGRA